MTIEQIALVLAMVGLAYYGIIAIGRAITGAILDRRYNASLKACKRSVSAYDDVRLALGELTHSERLWWSMQCLNLECEE